MEKLIQWMEITGIDAAQLGREIGASRNSVENWVSGRFVPNALYIRKLHERTSIPLDDLVPKVEAA